MLSFAALINHITMFLRHTKLLIYFKKNYWKFQKHMFTLIIRGNDHMEWNNLEFRLQITITIWFLYKWVLSCAHILNQVLPTELKGSHSTFWITHISLFWTDLECRKLTCGIKMWTTLFFRNCTNGRETTDPILRITNLLKKVSKNSGFWRIPNFRLLDSRLCTVVIFFFFNEIYH